MVVIANHDQRVFGSKIFFNPEQLTIEEITKKLTENLIDQQSFYPEKAGIEKFRFHRTLDDTFLV